MADTDGKMQTTKKVRGNKREMRMAKKENKKQKKKTIKERNLSFKSLLHGWTHVTEIRTLRSSVLNAYILDALNV